MKKIPLVFILLFALAACAPAPAGNGKAPDFALRPLSGGQSLRPESFRGKVLLLCFWSVSCGYCVRAVPALNALAEKYGGGLSVLGVNVGDDPEDVAAYVEYYKVRYQVGIDADTMASRRYRVRGIPTFVLIDKKGDIRNIWTGYDRALGSIIESSAGKLLQEPSGLK